MGSERPGQKSTLVLILVFVDFLKNHYHIQYYIEDGIMVLILVFVDFLMNPAPEP